MLYKKSVLKSKALAFGAMYVCIIITLVWSQRKTIPSWMFKHTFVWSICVYPKLTRNRSLLFFLSPGFRYQ